MPGRADSDHKEGRRDIQGLRAIAVLLVAFDHAGVPHFDGGFVGVDVFFVISGFLITGLLIRRVEAEGRFSLIEFYGRRALRIVPAAALVLLATDLASHYVMNVVRARDVMVDSVWASFFAANIRFSDVGTDYFAQDLPPSPFQHYWSLAVEEQFYLLWPVVLAAAFLGLSAWGRRSHGRHPGWHNYQRLGVVLTVIVAVSLGWSVYQTEHQPTSAYFSSLTRTWELGVGALIAVFAVELAPRRRATRAGLALFGLMAIVSAAVTFTPDTPFPGYAALLPVMGTGALVIGGLPSALQDTGEPGGPDPHEVGLINRCVGAWPLRAIGDVSYSFYLWHWPVLVLAAGWAGHDLETRVNILLVAGSFVLAVLTYHWVENPLRHGMVLRPDFEGLAVTWACSCSAVLVVSLFVHTDAVRQITTAAGAAAPSLGTVVHGPEAPSADRADRPPDFVVEAVRAAAAHTRIPAQTVPPIVALAGDWDSLGGCSGFELDVDNIVPCQIGDSNGSKTVVLFGDSHAEMWVPAFREIALRDHVRIYPYTKPGCGPEAVSIAPIHDCMEWYSWAEKKMEEVDPDVVVMVQHADETAASWSDSTIELGRQMLELADRVIVLGDSPVLPTSAPDCLLARRADLGSCAFPPNEALAGVDHESTGLQSIGLEYVQVSHWFCADNLCPTVMGNVVVYLDTNHITATYARELAGRLGHALDLRADDASRARAVDPDTGAESALAGPRR